MPMVFFTSRDFISASTRLFCLLFSLQLTTVVSANNPPEYETRREAFIQTALTNFNGDAITLQAYKGVPVDINELHNLLNEIPTSPEADFRLVKLIRVLFYSNGEYDSLILPPLRSIPYWIHPNEMYRQYWSENHMIMWSSTAYLLKQKYGWEMDSTVDIRVKHYLQLKIDHGFYEFFSSTYAPYCLSGILNLADFATDPEIKNLATKAAQRLLKDFMMLTNDKGTFFPVAGRNYYGKYDNPYGQNHSNIIYLLTGFGETPNSGSHASNFLASSSIPVDEVINSWTPKLDTLYHIGHTLQEGFVLNQEMSHVDKVMFQWSSGAYFHPLVAAETFQLVKDYNLWVHEEFSPYEQFSFLPSSFATTFANIATPITESSVISGEDVYIFKNKSVTLSSIQDFWKGKVGYQSFPVVANVGTTAVLTASGEVVNWNSRPERTSNADLPYVSQKQNLALIMYRPEKLLPVFGQSNFDVALHWNDNDFDELKEDGPWLMGRQEDGYVAVRRNCNGYINGIRACSNPDAQTWVIMVGNSDMYGSFENFQQIVHNSTYEEKWYFNGANLQWVYYAKIVADNKTIQYAWGADLLSGPTVPTGILDHKKTASLNIYPNPANDHLNLDLSAFRDQNATIRIFNTVGQEVYSKAQGKINPMEKISTANWNNGLYIISIESDDFLATAKFSVNH